MIQCTYLFAYWSAILCGYLHCSLASSSITRLLPEHNQLLCLTRTNLNHGQPVFCWLHSFQTVSASTTFKGVNTQSVPQSLLHHGYGRAAEFVLTELLNPSRHIRTSWIWAEKSLHTVSVKLEKSPVLTYYAYLIMCTEQKKKDKIIDISVKFPFKVLSISVSCMLIKKQLPPYKPGPCSARSVFHLSVGWRASFVLVAIGGDPGSPHLNLKGAWQRDSSWFALIRE